MKPPTSLQAPFVEHVRRTRRAIPEGIPTGVVYSYTFSPSGASANGDTPPEIFMLVKLSGGPMLMGTLTGASPREIHIGARVRMVFPMEEGEQPAGATRQIFELLRYSSPHAARASTRELEATAA